MIVLDTSAIMAFLLREPEADACEAVLRSTDHMLMSAATLTEGLIVAARRDLIDEFGELIAALSVEIVPLTASRARAAGSAYRRWASASTPPRSTSATASPMPWRRSIAARSSTSGRTSRGPTSPPPSDARPLAPARASA